MIRTAYLGDIGFSDLSSACNDVFRQAAVFFVEIRSALYKVFKNIADSAAVYKR